MSSINLASLVYTMSDECERTEHRSVIKFLVWKNKTNAKIKKELTSVYGTRTLKSAAVKKWVGRFRSGKESVGDNARAGRPATACNIEKVKQKIKKDRRKTIRDVADNTDISRTSEHKILWQNLEMKKVCLKLVLKVLMPEQKKERIFIAETFLNDCEADLMFLGWIIMGDESWVFKCNKSTKHQSMQWKRSDEPQHKKAHMTQSQQKFMLILFFDIQVMVIAEWVLYWKNVDTAFCIEMLWKLRIYIQKKRSQLWVENLFVLHHNNAPATEPNQRESSWRRTICG